MLTGPTISDVPKTSGIYMIRNVINDKRYIGSAMNFRKRWSAHLSELGANEDHHNIHLQRAWNKYGEDAFEFLVIDKIPIGMLIIREQLHMNLYPDSYNICKVAGSSLGIKHTPEACANMSAAKTGNSYRLGHVASPEACANNSAAQKGNQHCVGRVLSDETKAQISASLTGHKQTPERKANISVALIGNTNSLGRKDSDETKAKKSEAQKARWARKRAEADQSLTVGVQ